MAANAQWVTNRKTAYERWQEQEGIRVLTGFYIEDLKTVPVDPWRRMGGLGAFINLEGAMDSGRYQNDSYVCEIPSGGGLKPQKHLFEEIIYVLSGRGATSIWQQGGGKVTFEWQAGSLFAVPINAWYQHFNVQGNAPARLFAVTSAPMVINLFHNLDFVFGDDFAFRDRFDGDPNHFNGEGREFAERVWETNFIADVAGFPLSDYKERGAGGRNAKLEIGNCTLTGHISEFPVGTYKKAHRHGPGAHVIIVSGEGYSLMWKEGEPMQKFDWRPGSVIVPPDRWFHQHFNAGATPARYLALRWNSRKYGIVNNRVYRGAESVKKGGDQIEYEDQDPAVQRLFEAELAKRGIKHERD